MKVLALIALLIVACSQVPDGTLEPGPAISPEDSRHYEQLVLEGRGAFLTETRTPAAVELSHARYKQALELRSDEYEVLWQAARTAVWLGNFGPEKGQDDKVRDGLSYANTAVELKPEGEEALFYHGVLAGKLAELDNAYGLSGLKIIQQRMRQLIEKKSTYIYGGPDRVMAIVLMRSPGWPIGPGDWDLAEKHMRRALEIDPNWPENQLYMAELEFGLAKKRGEPAFADSARARLQKHFLSEDASSPMGSHFEFAAWQQEARNLIAANEE
jgi:tetratricopeptide (TPR) repeat protein